MFPSVLDYYVGGFANKRAITRSERCERNDRATQRNLPAGSVEANTPPAAVAVAAPWPSFHCPSTSSLLPFDSFSLSPPSSPRRREGEREVSPACLPRLFSLACRGPATVRHLDSNPPHPTHSTAACCATRAPRDRCASSTLQHLVQPLSSPPVASTRPARPARLRSALPARPRFRSPGS